MSKDTVPQAYWNALLGITTKAIADHNDDSRNEPCGSNADACGPLSDESRKWLEEAMQELVNSTDPSKIMDRVMGSLLRYATTTELGDDDQLQVADLALRLEDLLQMGDLAKKFHAMGGFDIITRLLNYTAYPELRSTGCDMLITMCENNPLAQDLVTGHPLFGHVFDLLIDSRQDNKFRYKLLGSVSAIVRSHAPAFDKFISLEGHEKLRHLSLSVETEERLALKSLRVLTSIAYTYRDDEDRADKLKEQVAVAYAAVASRRMEDSDELAFARDYLLHDVDWEDVEEAARASLVQALQGETTKSFLEQKQQQLVTILHKKYSATKCG